MTAPVVVVGGGVVGSAIAYFLRCEVSAPDVIVIERDPSYIFASSTRSISSIRQQFSTPLSILMSQFGFQFLRDAPTALAGKDGLCDIGLVERGYLFLAGDTRADRVLLENWSVQTALGAAVQILKPTALQRLFPWISTAGVTSAALGTKGEGWFDGYSLLRGLRSAALSRGAKYLSAEVVGVDMTGRRAVAARTQCGQTLPCSWLVNAAGPWARRLAGMVGVDLPVRARRRSVFSVTSPGAIPDMPLVIDTSGVYCRPEGAGYICGVTPKPECDTDDLDIDEVDHELFNNVIWPRLAVRIPQFEALKARSAWSGYYEYNTFDQNAFIGIHPKVENCVFANGFSGHGLQQAPAAGRGVSELISFGQYRSLDLSPLGFERLVTNTPIIERNVI